MFSGLRTRLFSSYILIIVIKLLVIGAALFVVLRFGNQVSETANLRMYNLLNQLVAFQDERGGTIPADGPTRLQRVMLNQLDRRINQRVLVVDSKGLVSFDSRRQYPEGAQLVFDTKPYSAPDSDVFPFQVVRGVFQNPDKSEWLFLAQAPDPNLPDQQLIMVAMRAPRLLSFEETIQYYGQDWLIPLLRAGLIGLVVAFILSLVITRSVARPLQDVSKAV